MSHVLLIYPSPDEIKSYRFGYSLLLLYIAADLRSFGHDVTLLDFSVEKYTPDLLCQALKAETIVVLEIDAFPLKRAVNVENAKKVAKAVRAYNSSIQILSVGKQCTLFNNSLDFVDITLAGDSEVAVHGVINDLLLKKKLPSFINFGILGDLSALPLPAYDLLTEDQIRGKNSTGHMHLAPSALLETARGCPGRCSFCQRKGWRARGAFLPDDNVLKNFQTHIRRGVKNIWVTDENFAADLVRAKRLLRSFCDAHKDGRSGIKICISAWVHVDNEFLDLAKAAGVSIISFGIESVDPTIQNFYKKPIDMFRLDQMLRHADDIGLYTIGNFIVGAPSDTAETIQASIDFAVSSSLDVVNVKVLDYMVGSELYDRFGDSQKGETHFFACKERGLAQLSLVELKAFSQQFATVFGLSRRFKLEQKIKRYGPPYIEE